jgi:CheY-like chemotaxis protein
VVLLVEDNEPDIELTKLSIEQTGRSIDLHVVNDGEQCMEFLRKVASFQSAPTPHLVLLDLHMPRMNGLEVLQAISLDQRLRSLPVIVLTTSNNHRDVVAAYDRGCSGYVVKPLGYSQFASAIDSILAYWLSLVVLP